MDFRPRRPSLLRRVLSPQADTALAIAKLCVSFASQSAFPSPESCELLDVGGIPGAGRQDFEVSNFDGLHRHGATPRYRPAKPTPPLQAWCF